MKITIQNEDNNVQIIHDDSTKFEFDLGATVDLTGFIKFISESQNPIECEPESFEKFKDDEPDIRDENLKLIEYIFKTVTAFNESYSEIYESEEEDTEEQENG
jgi:hypothetical protein